MSYQSCGISEGMRSYVLVLLFSCVASVRVNRLTHNIVAHRREELPPIYVPCGLTDIILLSAPIVNHNVTIFHLTNPSGDTRTLRLSLTKYALFPDSNENSLIIKYNRKKHRIITLLNNYKLFNLNSDQDQDDGSDILNDYVSKMRENEFFIGPLGEEDYGNWMLSLFANENGQWLEMFQVITLSIKEYIEPKDETITLQRGETFRFGFAYPVQNLESCEFTAPKTTYDRWYDRDQDNLDSCVFVVKNVTKDDEGLWKVVGVGKIAYLTKTFLTVH